MPSSELSVLIVAENRLRASVIEEGLREAGHARISVIHDVSATGRTIETLRPEIIVIDLEGPGRDTLEHCFSLARIIERPIAMFVDRADEGAIESAVRAGIGAYVVDGLRKERIKPVIELAISRFNALARLREELAQARSELGDRKLIEQAKGILMRNRALSEADAYALLRSTAMNENRKMVEIARSVVTAAGLLGS